MQEKLFFLFFYWVFFAIPPLWTQSKVLKVTVDYKSYLPKENCTIKYVKFNIKNPEFNSVSEYPYEILYEFDAYSIWSETPDSRLNNLGNRLLEYVELDSSSVTGLFFEAVSLLDTLWTQGKYPLITRRSYPKKPEKVWMQMEKEGYFKLLKENMRDPAYYSQLDSVVAMTYFQHLYPKYFEEKIEKVITYKDETQEISEEYDNYLRTMGKGCRIFMDKNGYNPLLLLIDAHESPQDEGFFMFWECQVKTTKSFAIEMNNEYEAIIFWAVYSNGKESPYYVWSGDTDEFYFYVNDHFVDQKIDPIPLLIQK